MKKSFMVILMSGLLMSLTGCSGVDSYIENKMMEKSGIFEDEKYMEYQSQREVGNTDENGYFIECTQQVQNGSIHVTFSTNNNLDINYYTDSACEKLIDITNCYLNPGASIYANVTISENVYSSMYEFASFNICQYDNEGKRTVIDKCEQITTPMEDGCLVEIKIPSDFKGKELSMEPLGRYRVTVSLKQPDFGGKINYYVEGKEITDSEYETYCRTVITMNFEPWEGWMCEYNDGVEYIVGASDSQTIDINGMEVNNVFTEDENHKPELYVTLEKSVGEDMEFYFEVSGLDSSTKPYKYKRSMFRNDCKIIDGEKIGTGKPIVFSIKNKAIPSGKAVKIVVTKTDMGGKTETAEIRYVDDLTELQEPIYIYKATEIATSTKLYSSIGIRISIVEVTSFTKASASENTVLTVYHEGTMEELNQGDLIEESQNVVVKLVPSTDYYIVGGNNNEKTEYQETMKYSQYVKEIESLIDKHYAEKICTVNLDTSDSFAKYVYTYCGVELMGMVKVKAGEEITLEYEITEDGYKLTEGAGGLFGFGKSYKKVTKKITLTADLDGKTITKEDFGIEVEKGE